MLVGPFDGQDGVAIVADASHVVTSPVVILGVEQPVIEIELSMENFVLR